MLPTMVLVNVIVSKTRQVWLRESVLACGIVLTTSAILLLTLMSRSPLRDYEHFTIVLAILFATIVQKIRFWYAAAGCTTSLLLTIAALSVIYAQSPERMLFAGGTLACVVLFALVGSYGLEREQRMGYLLRLRDRLRTEELEVVNLLDPLTGIGNRRARDRKIAGCSTGTGAVAILLIDIDHFKAFNDTNGHQAGDTCLAKIAHSIEAAIRVEDRAFRYGGEEFLVFLPQTNLDEAVKVGKKIRSSVATAAIVRCDDRGSTVTVSIGVAASSSASKHADFTSLIGRADEALYGAKRKGRDRIEAIATPEREVVVPFMRRGDRR